MTDKVCQATDKELADALVEVRVGKPAQHFTDEGFYFIVDYGQWVRLPTDKFVRDWRVAGACLEQMTYRELFDALNYDVHPMAHVDPRAIIEAFVEARK